MPGTLRVRDPADPSGQTWVSVSGAGPQGPIGPTGPVGASAGVLNDLQDVDTTGAVQDDGLLWDSVAGMWTPGVVAAGQGVFLPLDGSDPMTGNLVIEGANRGVTFPGGARIYSNTDKAIRICEDTAGRQPQIANNDGGGQRDIIDTVNWGTGNRTITGYLVLTGGNKIHMDASTSTPPHQWTVMDIRKADATWLNRLHTNYTGQHSNGPETEFKIEIEAGGYGTRTFTFKTDGNLDLPGSPVVADVEIRAGATKRMGAAPLAADTAGRVIDALQPLTFERTDTIATADDAPDRPPRVYDVGFAVEDLVGSDLSRELVRGDGEEQGYSLTGLVGVLVTETKALRARVAALEAGNP